MMGKWQQVAIWAGKTVLMVYGVADLALAVLGVRPDPYLPLWFKAPWDLVLILWAVCVTRKPGGGIAIRGFHPVLQFAIIVAAFLAALTDLRRLLPFAFLIPCLYWEGVEWAWTSLASLDRRGGG